jgi:hypothetical protein
MSAFQYREAEASPVAARYNRRLCGKNNEVWETC